MFNIKDVYWATLNQEHANFFRYSSKALTTLKNFNKAFARQHGNNNYMTRVSWKFAETRDTFAMIHQNPERLCKDNLDLRNCDRTGVDPYV